MNAKILLLLLLSYTLYGFILYVYLKPNGNANSQVETKLYADKMDELLERIEENKNIIRNIENNTKNDIWKMMETAVKKQPTALILPKKAKETFYFGKYKTPQKLLNISKTCCTDSEMNISYFEMCHKKYKEYVANKEYSRVVDGLVNFMTVDPSVDIDFSCVPPALPNIKCEDYDYVFGDKVTKVGKEPKIGILIQLGFDVDMLEVYLWEVYDVVDKFFITESVVTHSDQKGKPLMWEKIKNSPRFKRFADKIVHFVVDDASNEAPGEDVWVSERNQEKIRWEKFKEWNEKHRFFGDDDLIGFGDTDEIPSREVLAVFKQCTGDFTHVDVGITFFFGALDSVFISDHPIRGYPCSLGDPTFFTLRSAHAYTRHKPYPTRLRGRADSYILGGAHISPYMYVPFLMNKMMVATEKEKFADVSGSMEELEDKYKNESISPHGERIKKASDVMKSMEEHYYVPWIMRCVPDRYPSFFGKRDPRLYYPPCFFDFEC